MLVELRIGVNFLEVVADIHSKLFGFGPLLFFAVYLLMKIADILVFKYTKQGMTKRSQWERDF